MKKRIISTILAATAVCSCFAMGGCNKENTDGITEISWYLPGVLEGNRVDEVMDKVNGLLAERYNLKLKLICIDFGNYNSKLQVMNAGREAYDLAYTSNWTNDYFKNVSNGVFYDLTDELPTLAPELYKSISEAELQSISLDGRIYAVPNWQIQGKSTGFIADKEKLDMAGKTLDDINTLEDITDYLRKLNEVDPDCDKVGEFWQSLTFYHGMDELLEAGQPPVIYFNKEGKPEVINQFDTPEFEEYIKLRHQWVDEGLVSDKFDPNENADKKEVRRVPFQIHIYKPGLDVERTTGLGYEIVCKPISEALLSSAGINATLTGVSATSKHPQEAIKMLEVIHTDKEIFNLICYGLEGINYEKVSDNQINKLANTGYNGIADWVVGSIANSYKLAGTPEDIVEQTKAYNESANVSPLTGLQLSVDNIATEMANCRTVVNEQLKMLELGLTGDADAAIAKFRSDLKASNVDAMIEDIQKQVDEWWEKNK